MNSDVSNFIDAVVDGLDGSRKQARAAAAEFEEIHQQIPPGADEEILKGFIEEMFSTLRKFLQITDDRQSDLIAKLLKVKQTGDWGCFNRKD